MAAERSHRGSVLVGDLEVRRTSSARSMNSCTDSYVERLCGVCACFRSGSDSDGTRYVCSPAMPSASRLRRQDPHAGALPHERVGQRRAGVEQVLAVVEQQQQPLVLEVLGERLGDGLARLFLHAQHRRHRLRHETRVGRAARVRRTRRRPGTARATSAATCRPRRVLPLPPEPVSVSRRVLASSASTSAISFSRPMKLVNCWGRLFGCVDSDLSGGKSAGRPGCRSWYTCSGRARSLSRCAPRSRKERRRAARRDQVVGRLRQQRLAAVPGREEPATRLSGGPK